MVLEQLTRPELSRTERSGAERGGPDQPGRDRSGPELSAAESGECGYRNGTDRMIILRCIGPDQFFLERVVFPFELLTFQCPGGSEVEIWTHGLGGPELLESLASRDLIMEPEPFAGVAGAGPEASPWLPLP